MKQKSDLLNMEMHVREFDLILEQIDENSNKIAEKLEVMQSDYEARLRVLENKYQELDSRMRYIRID